MSHHVPGALGSKWGNPYKPKNAKKSSLRKCLERYENHIRKTPHLFNALMELEGKEMGCWCKPSPCHGDVLIKLFRERQSTNHLSQTLIKRSVISESVSLLEQTRQLVTAGSIPERTLIIDDDLTSNLSELSLSEPEQMNFEAFDALSTESILLQAGYTITEIKEIISAYSKSKCDHGNFGKSRPETHVFSQGKAYTYNKIEIPCPDNCPKKSKVSSKKSGSSLIPIPDKPISNLDPKAIPFNIEKPLENPNSGDLDAFTILKNIRIDNLKNVIIGQLNINSLRNKIQDLAQLMKGTLDILVITETKLDYTFPEKQFMIPGYKKPFRADRNRNGGGVIIYVRDDIPCDILLKHSIPENVEAIFV